jgi:hypothetical protein
MRWAGHVTRLRDMRCRSWHRVVIGDLRDRCHLKYLGLNGIIILKLILRKRVELNWIDLLRDTDKVRADVNTKMKIRPP